MRLLLISNTGQPPFGHCLQHIADFLGSRRRVGFVTAASLGDENKYFVDVRSALAPTGIALEWVWWRSLQPIDRLDAIIVGGGNTYALLDRLDRSGLLEAIGDRVRAGLPYIGSSAGANVAGPNILTTNDWNVIGCRTFRAFGFVPWNINPHYPKGTDPAMAPGSETRDERIAEYHRLHENPVIGIEEDALVRIEDDEAAVLGTGRVKFFTRQDQPRWIPAGEQIPAG